MRIGWITNCSGKNKDVSIARLLNVPERVIQEGLPKATDSYTVQELQDMDVIGLYDVDPSMADQCGGFANIHFARRMQ
mgnify:CR=1 FL=1